MQIARSGCSETAQEMEAFLRMDVTDETDINLEDNEGRIQTLAARYSGISGMSVLITNCHYVPIYPTICRWLRDQHFIQVRPSTRRCLCSHTRTRGSMSANCL